MVLDDTEVGFAQPEKSCSIKFCVTADVIVSVGVEILSILVAPSFLGVILSLRIDCPRTPIVLLPWDVWSSLQQQNALAARRELPSQGPSTRARTNDNEIVVFALLHSDDSSPKATVPYSNSNNRDLGTLRGFYEFFIPICSNMSNSSYQNNIVDGSSP